MNSPHIPIIDISKIDNPASSASTAKQISEVCRQHGFFYVAGHGVNPELQKRIETLSHAFFALPEEENADSHAQSRQSMARIFCIK